MESLDLDPEENSRIGYQAAVSLWNAGRDQFGARFNAMLTVNSVIVAGIGVALTGSYIPVAISLSVAGLVVGIVWLIWMKRDLEYLTYMSHAILEIEEKYLNPIKLISQGRDFADGKVVTLMISDVSPDHQMTMLVRLFRHRTFAYIIALVFIALYVIMLTQALLSL
jgi:hypothetical protein